MTLFALRIHVTFSAEICKRDDALAALPHFKSRIYMNLLKRAFFFFSSCLCVCTDSVRLFFVNNVANRHLEVVRFK